MWTSVNEKAGPGVNFTLSPSALIDAVPTSSWSGLSQLPPAAAIIGTSTGPICVSESSTAQPQDFSGKQALAPFAMAVSHEPGLHVRSLDEQ